MGLSLKIKTLPKEGFYVIQNRTKTSEDYVLEVGRR
jgi:hypothetical protein